MLSTLDSIKCGLLNPSTIGPRQRFLTSGGMGSMGFALPAAIGAALAAPA